MVTSLGVYSGGSGRLTLTAGQIDYGNGVSLFGAGAADTLVMRDGTNAMTFQVGNGSGGGSLVLNPAGAPGSPVEGQIYYDSSTHHFFGWNGSAWKQLDN